MARVARRYALNANLIFKWLKDPRFAATAAIEEKPVFLPVASSSWRLAGLRRRLRTDRRV